MPDIGIVIVTYNSEAEIGRCLDAATRTGAEVVVVDNGSWDATCREVARWPVRLISNPDNRGFAAAVNQGIRSLSTPFVLLLNPDAVILTSIEPLRACCSRPSVAGAGGKLVDAHGPQTGFMVRRLPSPLALICEALLINRLWPGNPVNWHYRCLGLDDSAEQEVEQPAGAFLMIRRDIWEALGGFDEEFHPLWFEDVDFARRAKDGKYRMYYVPQVVAEHTGGHSIPKISVEFRQFYWYRSFLRYTSRHFDVWPARGVCLAVMAGSIPRMIAGIVLNRSWKPVAIFGRIIRLAGGYLFSGGEDRTGSLV